MGSGPSCLHKNKEITTRRFYKNFWFYILNIVRIQCNDCGLENLLYEEWRNKIFGNNTYIEISKGSCKHEKFTVFSEEKIKKQREKEWESLIILFIFRERVYEKFYVTRAQCDRCGEEFYVEALVFNKWKKKEIVEEIGTWKKYFYEKEIQKVSTKTELLLVKDRPDFLK